MSQPHNGYGVAPSGFPLPVGIGSLMRLRRDRQGSAPHPKNERLLRKPLDRRIYELARKHCGAQPKWRATVSTLYEKSGSSASLREFRRLVKALAESNELPDYRMAFDFDCDAVTFYARAPKGNQA